MLIVSDTTPIISLMKVNRLDLLETMFRTVMIPKAVYDELTCHPRYTDEAAIVKQSSFLKVGTVKNIQSVAKLRQVDKLDAGESEAIVLSSEQTANMLLMDEHHGRQVAKRLGINITGTVGILLQAYDEGLLSGADVLECLERMRKTNIRISKTLLELVEKHVL